MKDKLIFDTTSLLDTDNVGAYLRAEDGSLLTHSKVARSTGQSFAIDTNAFDVFDAGLDNIDLLAGHSFRTGDAFKIDEGTGTLPVELVNGQTYYVIRVSSTAIKIAASQADAYAGTFIDFSSPQVAGTFTLSEVEVEKNALDVSIVDGLNVEVDLDANTDSVSAWLKDSNGNSLGSVSGGLITVIQDSAGDLLEINGDGSVNAVVSANDLDIRDLSHTQDSIQIGDGTDLLAINVDGSINAVVSANDLDIRDLQFATDQVQIGNASGVADFDAGITTAQTLRVTLASDTSVTTTDAALANGAVGAAALDTGVIGGQVLAGTNAGSPIADRKYLYIYNTGNKTIYIGPDGSVDPSSGFPISPGSYMMLRAGQSSSVAVASSVDNVPFRVLELS